MKLNPQKAGEPLWPDIPNFLKNPIVFRDKNLGIVLVADYQGAQWIHKIVNGAWMSVRKVNADDPTMIIEPLNVVDISNRR
jgi:hypothetical protein